MNHRKSYHSLRPRNQCEILRRGLSVSGARFWSTNSSSHWENYLLRSYSNHFTWTIPDITGITRWTNRDMPDATIKMAIRSPSKNGTRLTLQTFYSPTVFDYSTFGANVLEGTGLSKDVYAEMVSPHVPSGSGIAARQKSVRPVLASGAQIEQWGIRAGSFRQKSGRNHNDYTIPRWRKEGSWF